MSEHFQNLTENRRKRQNLYLNTQTYDRSFSWLDKDISIKSVCVCAKREKGAKLVLWTQTRKFSY
jgi:hypothetical protein